MARTTKHATRGSLLLSELPLRQDYGMQCEASRQRFRQFRYSEAAGPQEAFLKLWELCSRWLKPKVHSAEDIVELLVLEQFLRILPSDLETRVRTHAPEDRQRLFSLIEDLQRGRGRPECQANMDGPVMNERGPAHPLLMLPNMLSQASALYAMEPVTDPLAIRQAEPQDLKNRDVGRRHPPLGLGTNFHRWYEKLESPGKETPEQLLADCLEPMMYQRPSPGGIPGSSHQEQPLGPQPHKQKSPAEKAHCSDQGGQCSAHQKQLITHQKLHTGELVPSDPGDGNGSSQGADHSEHQYFQEGQRPCECSVCTKPFSHVTQVSGGQRKQADREMYHCSECRRKFVYRSSLQAHLKAHTKAKSHECPTCGKSFKWSFALVRHQKTHTTERPFACEYCQKTYKYRSGLLTHLITHTGENVPSGMSGNASLGKEEDLVADQGDQGATSGAEFLRNEMSCTGPAEDTTP